MSGIIKLLGIMDIFIAIVFWIFGIFRLQDNTLMMSFIMLLGFVILVKGVAFVISADIASILDIVCGLIIIGSTAVIMPKVVVIIVALFLLQKGIFSMLS